MLVREGDRRAFDELVKIEGTRQLAIATRALHNRELAEDAVQDAFASAWIARRRFDVSRPFGAWITRITLNKCRDIQRRNAVRNLFWMQKTYDDPTVPDESPDPEQTASDRAQLKRVEAEIEALPRKLRDALLLTTIDGFSYADAASILKVSPKTIEMRTYHARKRLKTALQEI
nr:RNA polymerase sigma factor [Pacificimonas flava]